MESVCSTVVCCGVAYCSMDKESFVLDANSCLLLREGWWLHHCLARHIVLSYFCEGYFVTFGYLEDIFWLHTKNVRSRVVVALWSISSVLLLFDVGLGPLMVEDEAWNCIVRTKDWEMERNCVPLVFKWSWIWDFFFAVSVSMYGFSVMQLVGWMVKNKYCINILLLHHHQSNLGDQWYQWFFFFFFFILSLTSHNASLTFIFIDD